MISMAIGTAALANETRIVLDMSDFIDADDLKIIAAVLGVCVALPVLAAAGLGLAWTVFRVTGGL